MAVMIPIAFVAVTVPPVFVPHASAIAFPIAVIITLAVVARAYPYRATVRRPGPISVMPLVVIPDWIPIAIHPEVSRARSYRPDPNHPWRRRRSDSNSNGNLGISSTSGNQHQREQYLLHDLGWSKSPAKALTHPESIGFPAAMCIFARR